MGWAIGALGLVLVVIVSIHQLSSGHAGTAGVPVAHRLPHFVAPLATGSLNGDVNVHPRCDPRRANPQALNVCGRGRLVLTLFASGSAACVRAVDALAAAARRLRSPGVVFAAVAIGAHRRDAARLVRRHHWTLPVAYDRDGGLGTVLSVAVCPIVEVVDGDTVRARLIGERWNSARTLIPQLERALR